MHSDLIEGAPGTVSQVRASAQELVRFAKEHGSAVVLVGHVTKDGTIAGPRVLEHMVDTVLSFEGERSHQYRILRALKNRFGGTDEIGVFAMEGQGLVEVANPSALFLTHRGEAVSGTSVFPAIEGSRPVLVEIQALTMRLASGATPRRAAVGWDSGRLAMILAVLEARCGLSFATAEVYLNVAGGYRLSDPAADLAVAAALVSALSERPVPQGAVVLGEIALSGEIRPVAHAGLRLKESAKLGFESGWVPKGTKGARGASNCGVHEFAAIGRSAPRSLAKDQHSHPRGLRFVGLGTNERAAVNVQTATDHDQHHEDGLPAPRRYWSAAGIWLALAMAVLDGAIANVALPVIAHQLGASPAASIWIINAYQLTITVLLLPLAAFGDRVGYKCIYIPGLALFTIGSVACAAGGTLSLLIAARVLQGIGAACIMSMNAALVRATYPAKMLGRGIGYNAMVLSISAAIGPTLAALILSVGSWQWLFLINLPIGIAALIVGRQVATRAARTQEALRLAVRPSQRRDDGPHRLRRRNLRPRKSRRRRGDDRGGTSRSHRARLARTGKA